MEKILNKLKTEKLCPSKLGLKDYYINECTQDDCVVDCDACRENSVKEVVNGDI
jgi:hypothetical protein